MQFSIAPLKDHPCQQARLSTLTINTRVPPIPLRATPFSGLTPTPPRNIVSNNNSFQRSNLKK
jgi:hypothetical protein